MDRGSCDAARVDDSHGVPEGYGERLHMAPVAWGDHAVRDLDHDSDFICAGTQLIGHGVFASGLSAACFHKLDSDSGMDSARLHCHRSRVPQSLRQGSLNGVFGAVHGLIGVRFTFIQVQFRS